MIVRKRKLYSYVVDHDYGYAPNPEDGLCTLARCKFGTAERKNLVEIAEVGDWVIGTVGQYNAQGACADKVGCLLYAMKVTEKITLEEYIRRYLSRSDAHTEQGCERNGMFGRYALLSDCYYYFGRNAIKLNQLPACDHPIVKSGQGYQYRFYDEAYIAKFEEWLIFNYQVGKHGEPCLPFESAQSCKSLC